MALPNVVSNLAETVAAQTSLSLDLQLWPELVEISSEVHSSLRKSFYVGTFQGDKVALKVRVRSGMGRQIASFWFN